MRSRLRVSIGFLLAALCCLFGVASAFAGAAAVVAQTASYQTDLLVESLVDEPLEHDFSRCMIGRSGAAVALKPGGAAILRDPITCVGGLGTMEGIGLVDVPATLRVWSLVRFDDGATRASYTLPAIHALPTDGTAVVVESDPLVSDDREIVTIVVFPIESQTPIRVTLYDLAGGAEPVTETFAASPPVAQYQVQARGVIRASVGVDCWIGFCPAYGAVYGFVTSGAADSATVRAYPFPP